MIKILYNKNEYSGPLVTVFVLNWNRKEDLLRCLNSINNQTYLPIEILVVDNGSTDGSAEAVISEFPEVRLIKLDRNYGCPGGRNRGIKHAKGEFIFFVDNDGILHRQAVERAYRSINRDKRISVITGMVKPFSALNEVDINCDVGSDDRWYYSPNFKGGVSLHRKAMYKDVGFYPDDYMYGAEEAYLSLRILDNGCFMIYDPTVILWHKKAKDARDRKREFITTQSNVLVNTWILWPIELAAIYTLRSLFINPFRAFKAGLFMTWLQNSHYILIRAVYSALKMRQPVQRKTMQIFWQLTKKKVKSQEDVFIISISYLKFIYRLFWGKQI